MADFYVKSGSGAAPFVASATYNSGDRVVPRRPDIGSNYLIARRWVWECTTGGAAAASDPTWPSSVTQDVTTVTSGAAIFTARKPGFSSGSTIDWAFATIYADYLNGALAAGDVMFLSSAHDESHTNVPLGQCWQVDASGGPSYVDQTADANDAGDNDVTLFPADCDAGDYVLFGYAHRFSGLIFDYLNGTVGTSGVLVWEYWNGSTWASLTGLLDSTAGFTAAAADGRCVSWNIASNWAATSINGSVNLFYVRARVTTEYTVDPVMDQVYVTGDIGDYSVPSDGVVLPGTITTPCYMLSVSENGASRPNTLTAGARISSSGNLMVGGTVTASDDGFVAYWGLHLRAGIGHNAAAVVRLGHRGNNDRLYFTADECVLQSMSTGVNGRIDIGTDGGSVGVAEFTNLRISVAVVSHLVQLNQAYCHIRGGGRYNSEGVTPTGNSSGVFHPNSGRRVLIDGWDFSGYDANVNLVRGPGASPTYIMRNCKLPASWSGSPNSPHLGIDPAGWRTELYDCDSGATSYRLYVQERQGRIRDETAVVRTGGHAPGGTPLSWCFGTTADCGFPAATLRSPEFFAKRLNSSDVGVSRTLKLELIYNGSAALNNDEAWAQFIYKSESGSPLGAPATSRRGLLASAAALAASTAAWDSQVTARANSTAYAVGDPIKLASNPGRVFFCTVAGTTAGSEPGGYATAVDGDAVTDNTATFRAGRRHKIEVVFTPQLAGHVYGQIHVAKPSLGVAPYVLFVCPKAEVS